ncbi:FAD-binding oxidoreductase [Novosphingobium sp.]|uniref:NAD(P)/FAD-dependent oxidoreductase n=1 Tax=Novosphingobium sp. TaxID=1874826 RepID=UPI001D8BD461|nr:FAD-binding oxidoreductase [Novosphingobium sp.]MBX9665453.1 FAD-binding oxidoreductase [Novosphingobium sp.]
MTSPRIVIIGGGIIGSLTARALCREGLTDVTVIERDPTYRFSSTALSAASIRTQFGCPVNVELSLYGAQFLKGVKAELGEDAEIDFVEGGYLILGDARTEAARREALAMQRGLGAMVEDFGPDACAAAFPWLSTDDIAIATLGRQNEGWFDAWSLLQAARRAAIAGEARFVQAEASGFITEGARITGVRADGAIHPCDWVINAAGPGSGAVARLLGIDLPVRPRKRTVFQFKAPLAGAGMPMLFDISGAWMRPEGDGFIGGIQPDEANDPDADGDFEPDHALFEDRLWPLLAARVPALEQLRLVRAWAGHYEMCLFDHNGVIGPHPDMANLVFATGFSGHGVMHAPGTARGVAEWIAHGHYRTIDLSPLGFGRIAANRPMPESAIY